MFSHINIGINDLERQYGFYAGLMDILGYKRRFAEKEKGWAGWQAADSARPLFLIARPFDGGPASPGNGQMTAFLATSRRAVDRAHAHTLAQGGSDEGAPGLRPHYHANYYGAYFRDPEGNKLCVMCHAPE
jgi:catechol 2,3-dioxygenase-like lactoylglutathione lyase family enzyme